MSKFCRSCGYALEEGATTCPACGKSTSQEIAPKKDNTNEILNKVSEVILVILCLVEKLLILLADKIGTAIKNAGNKQPAAEGAQAPSLQKDSKLNVVRLAIVVIMIVLCLIGTIMNLTMKYDVSITATLTYDDESKKETQSGPMEDLAENDEFMGLILVNMLWAVFNIVLIVMSILVLLKVLKLANTDGRYKGLAMTGLIGDVLYMILYKVCGSGTQDVWGATMKYSTGFHAIVWIHVVFFAVALALAYVSLTPAAPAAVDAPAAE